MRLTTPKVAKAAGVSVGCFYSYFKDKDDLFTAVLDRYSSQFDQMREDAFLKFKSRTVSFPDQLHSFLLALVRAHEESKALNAQMKLLYHTDSRIAARMDRTEARIQAAVLSIFQDHQSEFGLRDPEAASIIIVDFIDSLVDRMVFGTSTVDRNRLLSAGIEYLCSFLGLRLF